MNRIRRSSARSGRWKRYAFRTMRVTYTASKFVLTMIAPAHPEVLTAAPSAVEVKAESVAAQQPALFRVE